MVSTGADVKSVLFSDGEPAYFALLETDGLEYAYQTHPPLIHVLVSAPVCLDGVLACGDKVPGLVVDCSSISEVGAACATPTPTTRHTG